ARAHAQGPPPRCRCQDRALGLFRRQARAAAHHRERGYRHDLDRVRSARGDAAAASGRARGAGGRAGARTPLVAGPHVRRAGGNLDNKELVAGSTLYLPIQVDGALFSVGDGHGAQGDGEVCVTAIETGLIGTFELSVRDDLRLEWPRAETPTHVMTMAFD